MTISPKKNEKVLVVGATSSLGQALCRELAGRGWRLILAGRNRQELDFLASDLAVRFGCHCPVLIADFLDPGFNVRDFIEEADDFTHLLMAAGDMGNGNIEDIGNIAFTAHLNYTLPAQICAAAAQALSARGGGTVAVISSVAGDRGRAGNAAYGAAKAALTAFASGLRASYAKQGVHVMTVKPGFVDTPMTWGMKSPLIAGREKVAAKIVMAMEKKKDAIYVPWFWRFIMLAITHIPERVFKKLKL